MIEKAQIHKVIRETLKPLDKGFVIESSMNLVEDLDADSLTIIELVMELESEFDIDIDDNELDVFTTVESVEKLVQDLA